MVSEIRIYGIAGIPELEVGDDLADVLLDAMKREGFQLRDGDILVITSKIVSKTEGRTVKIDQVRPSEFAKQAARMLRKDPRVTELILSEAKRVVRMARGLLLVESRHGFVCANGGVDQSNVPLGYATLLPLDPDRSARVIREEILKRLGVDVAVIISDTSGRPWREGQTDVAVGVAGMKPIKDYRGLSDPYGYELKVTAAAVADELASAAELVMEKLTKMPVAVIRGYKYSRGEGRARDLVRPPSRDLFR